MRKHVADKKSAKKEKSPEAKRTEIMENMNAAALEAEEEYKELPKATRAAIKEFFTKWYPKAGYKKLGKMIVGKPFVTEIE